MSKSASIVLICILTILILFFGVFAFYPNVIEYGDYNEYRSPLNIIQKSKSFTKSEKATYQVNLDEGTNFSTVKSVLNFRLARAYGYYNVGISYDEKSGIATFVIPQTNNPDEATATSILSNVTQTGKVEILSASSYSESNIVLKPEHFKRARTQRYASGENTVYVCEVTLTNEGLTLAQASLSSSSSSYIAIDETVSSNYGVFLSNGKLQIQSFANVDALAAFINGGVLNASLIYSDSEDVTTVGGLVYIVLLAAMVVASIIFFLARYKTLGIAGVLSQLIAVVIFAYFAGGVYFEMFNLFAAIGIVLAYALMTAFTVWTLELMRIDGRVSIGKALRLASLKDKSNLKSACGAPLLIAHAVMLVLGVILWVIPTCVTAPLGNVFVYGAILSFVATYALNRLFVHMVEPLVEVNTAKRK